MPRSVALFLLVALSENRSDLSRAFKAVSKYYTNGQSSDKQHTWIKIGSSEVHLAAEVSGAEELGMTMGKDTKNFFFDRYGESHSPIVQYICHSFNRSMPN